MNPENSNEIADLIYNRLQEQFDSLRESYLASKDEIGFFFIDNILPLELAKKCYEVFPDKSEMRCLKSIREYKYVSAQMNNHNELLEDVLYAFQHKKVVEIIGKITDKKAPDEKPSIIVAQEILDTYVGKYELQPGFVIEVTTTNGQLFAQATGQPQFEVFAEDENTFFLKVVKASIDFNKDDSGQITSITLNQNGQSMPAKRIE